MPHANCPATSHKLHTNRLICPARAQAAHNLGPNCSRRGMQPPSTDVTTLHAPHMRPSLQQQRSIHVGGTCCACLPHTPRLSPATRPVGHLASPTAPDDAGRPYTQRAPGSTLGRVMPSTSKHHPHVSAPTLASAHPWASRTPSVAFVPGAPHYQACRTQSRPMLCITRPR